MTMTIDMTGRGGRDEQRENWNDHGRQVARDAFDPSGDLLILGLDAYSFAVDAVEVAVLRACPPLTPPDHGQRGGI